MGLSVNRPLVCVTVTAPTTADLRRRRDEVVDADLVELRLDSVSDPDVPGALAGRRRPVIVTCRPAWEGGEFRGSEEERRRLLTDALALGAEYDLAVAAYLLNYARNKDELGAMCRGIARCLKPGGRFVAANTNPGIDLRSAPSYRKFGFETHIGGELREGGPITWTFFLRGGSISVENYYLDVAAHEAAFRSAGFREVRWHRPRLSPEGELAHGRGYWATFLDHPPVIFIECLT